MVCCCVLPYSNPNACRTCPNNPYRDNCWDKVNVQPEPIDYERLAEEIVKKMRSPVVVTYSTYTTNNTDHGG